MPERYTVNADNIQTIHRTWLEEPITTLRADRMAAGKQATMFALALGRWA